MGSADPPSRRYHAATQPVRPLGVRIGAHVRPCRSVLNAPTTTTLARELTVPLLVACVPGFVRSCTLVVVTPVRPFGFAFAVSRGQTDLVE